MNNTIVASVIIFFILLAASFVIFNSDETATKAPVEAVTEVPAETVTEVPVEAVTEVPVEAVTEVPVEAVTEAPVETVTEVPVETVTEVPVEAVTEAPVEAVTEAPAEAIALTAGGKDYQTLCSSCHGADGTGNGLKASTLKTPASDLTILSQANDNNFPYVKIRRMIDGRIEKGYFRAHRTGDMPVWGDVFTREKGSSASEQLHARATSKMRILDLVDYLVTIQK